MTKTIMVVDDEDDIRSAIQVVLENVGYEVLTAESGDDCLAKIKDSPVDLVLLDVMMPGTPAKDVPPKIPDNKVVYITVVRKTDAEKEGLLSSNNVVGFIQKPFDIDALISNVKKIVEE